MVNVEDPDYQMCVDNQFLVRDSKGYVRPLEWWHGSGGLLDYSNPDAVAWWHQQMDKVLDAGVDGFKCDGTDPYIDEYELTGMYVIVHFLVFFFFLPCPKWKKQCICLF
jgi:alpha-glucosidase (family GH31 glycosyl hydrolase)